MKKLFSFTLILLLGAGLFGLPAIPPRPGGDAPGMIIAEADIPETATVAPREAVFLVDGPVLGLPGAEAFYNESDGLICGWFEQYQAGFLSSEEFMTPFNSQLRTKGLLRDMAPGRFYLLC